VTKKRYRVIWKLLLCLAAAYAGVLVLLVLFQGRMLYFPIRELGTDPGRWGLPFEEVFFETEDGIRLHGWFLESDRSPSPRCTVLFFHGNAGNIAHRGDTARILHEAGAEVLLWDYRGYGRSGGRPSEAGTRRDARAAWRYLVEDRGIPPDRIVLFGRSLGAAVAARLATETSPRGLIVESGFTSVPDLARRYFPIFPVRLMARFVYDTREAIRRVRCPVLVVHSRDDETIPYSHGVALHEAAPDPKEFLEIRGSHNEGFLSSGERYVEGLRRFLR
jgi:fermentation-respiration switch protein FrsA (DUF1100 family)